MSDEQKKPEVRRVRAHGVAALAAVMAAGIGGAHGPRRIGKSSFLTGWRSILRGRKREWTDLGRAQRERIAAQIEKGVLRAESPERFALWLERRQAIAARRAAMDPGQKHPPTGHTTKGARRRKAKEAARVERAAQRAKARARRRVAR
ncbi:MAG: hypothetical protein AB7I13_00055 [Vicinamibacterales bacterium]